MGEVGLSWEKSAVSSLFTGTGSYRIVSIETWKLFDYINLLAGRDPQEQRSPDGFVFSVEALSQVQLPAGRAPIEMVNMNICFAIWVGNEL